MRIDVHAHVIPESFVEVSPSDREEGAYTVKFTDETSGEVLYTARSRGANFIAEQMYSTDRRLSDMDARGIDMHALSVPTTNLFYGMEPEKALKIARRTNDGFAALVASHPDRFVALASVPLQEPEGAARELERAVREDGLRGVQIATNVNGMNLDDPSLTPFYRKVQELDVPVFIHPNNVLGSDRLNSHHLGNLIGNPTEDALAAASLIFGGVLKEFPRLKFYIAHGGGSCPFLRGRWEHGWRVRDDAKTKIDRPPSEYFRLLYFDSLTHSGPALNYLVETCGPERVMLGSDYPYDMSDTDPVRAIASVPGLSDAQRELIYGGNAMRLFKIEGAA
jgi:aminocarboxymuconate-semialdehyde decarboxylase